MFLLATGILAAVSSICLGIKIFAPWLHYDLVYLRKVMKIVKEFNSAAKITKTVADYFDETVAMYPNKVFIVFQENSFTYKQVQEKANQVARAALEMGLHTGDVVAIMMYNQPALIWTYLGLQKIGVQQAFINHNLRSKSLAHCINVCEPKLLIVGQGKDLLDSVTDIQDDLVGISFYSCDTSLPATFKSFTEACSSMSTDAIDVSERALLEFSSVNCYIFTSGTTGLPKPAIVTHAKTLRGALVMWMFDISRDDIVYEPLPMYHSAGLIVGIGSVLSKGATVVLREKFSATRFWDDCRKHNVTIIHYVGELLRYLVNTPESADDKKHCVKHAIGNGLRRDVWLEFQRRFSVPNMVEFYAATEMPIGFINLFNKFGACGRSSPFLRKIVPCTFVKYDVNNDTPFLGDDGLCLPCGADEVGLLVVPLGKDVTFEGYKNQTAANEKKLIKNVFKQGDTYVNAGDLFYVDKDYFTYFHDRVGDTFRWKGENVSTTEVSNVVSSVDFLQDACCYGVLVPGCEGRAGMVAVCPKDTERSTLSEDELDVIRNQCKELLPSYARPRFLRLQKEFEITSTFKQRKVSLQKEGFDVPHITEPVYYLDTHTDRYLPLNSSTCRDITNGRISV
ncbi:very long-chain acyl-CoA synthetase-like [Mizuhopecten yessoensis]|uniref:Very long-chain fatty acid transport protein n=1 Tax=Mizuhopecten yessoensis TaxID=6573 RepID=A0A210PY83_MIZYE|nr:very long-chain acyl-CoA synthetase-like [Mizuhopecten yessoensis]OWF41450.1 Very long-chain acyl-CoA synthetase [Mizuhopecten yessoensis]